MTFSLTTWTSTLRHPLRSSCQYVIQAMCKGHHWPASPNEILSDVSLAETWHAMEDLVSEGLVKNIGVANFSERRLQELMSISSLKVMPAVNQVELHPYLQQPALVSFCQRSEIAVTAYSALGSADRPHKCPDDPVLLEDPTLRAIAARRPNCSAAQVALRWAVQRNTSCLAKSVNRERIAANLAGALGDAVGKLTQEEMAELAALDKGLRYVPHTGCLDPNNLPPVTWPLRITV
eukprot:TRINITY_DN6085_c0_g1_i4.p1 TRINITY_DN6085_c0_g1~~TRINITY_DN6085_c0_g1_i4.p1  ORF type:complete len:235 (-),score=30.48 TRINITY_DN6085_c0_g1_i4:274-978(-)